MTARRRDRLELAEVLERPEGIYLVHVEFTRQGTASRVRVTSATPGAVCPRVLSAGAYITYHLAFGGLPGGLTDLDYVGPVARCVVDLQEKGGAIVRTAYQLSDNHRQGGAA